MPGNQDHVALYRDVHASKEWGNTSVKNLRYLRPEIALRKPRSVLDYGCGQSPLLEALDLPAPTELVRYDPAIPAYATPPEKPVDLLINIDVLEHIPEGDLDDVVAHMASLCTDAVIVVDTLPASLILPNGQNAHCTVHPAAWWRDRLGRHFPTLVPIRVARRSRAAFRTWHRKPGENLRFRLMRLKEDVAHYGRRLLFGKRR